MIPLPASVRIYVATAPADMRKSFDGLSALAQNVVAQDPMSGHLFVWFSRRGNQVRVLFWDRTGYAILAKRLERGTFRLAKKPAEGATYVTVDAAELSLILEGIDLRDAKRRRRWTRSPNTERDAAE
jgi:transposase